MRLLLLLACLTVAGAAQAQKLTAAHPSVTYKVGKEPAYLYREPADTTSKSSQFLSPSEEAYVVGEFSPRWAVVKRSGALYLTPARKLVNYDTGDSQPLPIDSQTGRITYEGVVEVPGISKADLYTRANAWVAHSYRSAQDVIQLNDKEAGQLIVKGLARVTSRGSDFGVVHHTLTVYVKDGRYKYVLTDFTHDASSAPNIQSAGPLEQPAGQLFALNMGAGKPWADIKRETAADARRLMASLQTAMTLQGIKDPSDF